MKDVEDHELVKRCQRGDRDAFGELVRRYQDRIFNYIVRTLGCREDALELTQDTFVKAFRSLPNYRPDSSFRSWLFRIAGNTALDLLRRRRTIGFISMDDCTEPADPGLDPESHLLLWERNRQLLTAFHQLKPGYRQILILREYEGMSYDEIGAALGLRKGTVKSRLARARKALVELCTVDDITTSYNANDTNVQEDDFLHLLLKEPDT